MQHLKFPLALLFVYGPLCALCAWLFHSGHPVAGSFALAGILFTSVTTDKDKG